MRGRIWLVGFVVMLGLSAPAVAAPVGSHTAGSRTAGSPGKAPAVVVATFDTGTNPFHPCFRRTGLTHPRQRTPGYPSQSKPLRLTVKEDYEQSLAASEAALSAIETETLYHLPGTNLSFYGGAQAPTELVDDYPHGAQASSQIACAEFGMAPDAQLVILNWYDDPTNQSALLSWVTEQAWIDVVHLNIQDVPRVLRHGAIERLIATGKVVVIAAGNGVIGQGANYPMELSSYNGPPGSLIAGANDNGGYTYFSNLNPHVVMDGAGTTAAAPASYETASFGGTSSASPRITGYVARLIADLRAKFGHTGSGLVNIPRNRPRPRLGPLADGQLTAEELHEVIRKTADPNPHDSRYDGRPGFPPVVQPVALPYSFYPKMGYGEVSEHTVAAALDVLSGGRPMPDRAMEDRFYAASEAIRGAPVPSTG